MYLMGSAIYWFVMGAFMTGEATELSQRVKRRLPQSYFGRMFLTWFNPGAGTGYLFAVSNVLAAAIFATFTVWYGLHYAATRRTTLAGMPSAGQAMAFIALLCGYLICYLGIGNLLLRLLRRFTQVTLAAAVLINGLLLLAGWGIP